MMSTPYFRSYWGMPPSSSSSSSFHTKPSVRGIPMATTKPKASTRVVSIPVHFVGSELSRSDSALKIQKALRGFLVRKNLKKIAIISNEVNQIERNISDDKTIGLIRKDSKERLRLSETLMNLLLRLDSVTSVDFGVRVCRKSVIKKAIALQEKLDLISSTPDCHVQDQGEAEDEADSNAASQEVNSDLHDEAGEYGYDRSEGISEFPSPVKQDDKVVAAVDSVSELRENVEASPVSVHSEVMFDSEFLPENPGHEASTIAVNPPLGNETMTEANENGFKKTPKEDDYVGTRLAGEQSGTCEAAGTAVIGEEEEEINSSPEIEGRDTVEHESEEAVRDGGDDNGRKEEQNREGKLLQRMIDDNERMMGLMAELFERNAIQTRLLSSLSERVQKLEKAFTCEKLRKKRKTAAAATDGSYKLPDIEKM